MAPFGFLATFFAVCFVAYSNGANANFKGVASLFGSKTMPDAEREGREVRPSGSMNACQALEAFTIIGDATHLVHPADARNFAPLRGGLRARGRNSIPERNDSDRPSRTLPLRRMQQLSARRSMALALE